MEKVRLGALHEEIMPGAIGPTRVVLTYSFAIMQLTNIKLDLSPPERIHWVSF